MNKGKNIVILLACLLCLSLYTFLLFSNAQKRAGFVDDVSYSLQGTKDGIKTFMLQNDPKNTVTVERSSPNEWDVSFENESYTVKGNRNNMITTPYDEKNQNVSKSLLSELVFGSPPIINLTQAVITIVIGLIGVSSISKAEELWYIVYKKDKSLYPKMDEIFIFKAVGGIIVGIAVVLLVVFIII